MKSGMVVNVNFVTNPIVSTTANGKYNGLFYETNVFDVPTIKTNSSGLIGSFNLQTNFNYSGTMYLDGKSHTVAGTFNKDGDSTTSVKRATALRSNVWVSLHLNWDGVT